MRGAKARWQFGSLAWIACGILISIALWLRYAEQSDDVASASVADIQTPRPAEEIACPSTSGPRQPNVLLILGQSNAANHGAARSQSRFGSIWVDGRCYAIIDPLPGGTGTGGSLWSRLVESVDSGSGTESLLLVVLAISATRVTDWTRPGAVSDRLTRLLAGLRANHLTITAVLWQQGEADAQTGTGREDYAVAMTDLVRRLRVGGIAAPVLLARSTRCHNSGSPAVRDALAEVAQHEPNVFLGPDLDLLGDELRFDGCHLSDEGLRRAADAWVEALMRHGIVDRR